LPPADSRLPGNWPSRQGSAACHPVAIASVDTVRALLRTGAADSDDAHIEDGHHRSPDPAPESCDNFPVTPRWFAGDHRSERDISTPVGCPDHAPASDGHIPARYLTGRLQDMRGSALRG